MIELCPTSVELQTVDAIAKQAGVARMTVYYQFGSKPGLLEALFDELASTGQMSRMREAFTHSDPDQTLAIFVQTFAGFYDSARVELRRLNALTVLDPEISQGIEDRSQRRRMGAGVIVDRLSGRSPLAIPRDEAMAILNTLTSFDTFDTLAGPDRHLPEIVPTILRMVRASLGLCSEGP